MDAIKFPQMFNNANNTATWKPEDFLKATRQNLELLLQSERGELAGDPYYGILLKRFLFEQNNYILRDMLIDVLYTQISLFMPQLRVERRDIKVFKEKEKGKVYCTITGINQIDYQVNTYSLKLFEESDMV